jgi:quercetin dioxygenase-like cupin family protein
MKRMLLRRRTTLLIMFMLTLVSGAGAQPGPLLVAPAELKWQDAPPVISPGVKMAVLQGDLSQAGPYTYRLQLPAGYKVMPHRHPGDEHVTVLSGTLYMGIGEKFDPEKAKVLPTGGFLVVPAQIPHFGWSQDESVVQVHGMGPSGITYVNPADDPSKK